MEEKIEDKEINDYTKVIRKRILEKLKDLETKIRDNEPLPEGEQGLGLLVEISDNIDLSLNNWYY